MRLKRGSDTVNEVSPVIEAAARDEKLREHARKAAAASADAYSRLRGRRGATDKRLPDDIGTAARELSEVARRLVKAAPKRRRTGLRAGLPLAALALAAAGYLGWKKLGSHGAEHASGNGYHDVTVEPPVETSTTTSFTETTVVPPSGPETTPGGPAAP